MLNLALSVAFAALTALPQDSEPQAAPSLLAAAPADALFVAYSPDLGAVREVALESPWYRYFASGPGREYVDFGVEFLTDSEPELEQTLAICRPLDGLCRSLRGEALVFATARGLGVVLETGDEQQSADQAITDFLDGLPGTWTLTVTEYEGTPIELWESGQEDFVLGRAMGGGVTALFFGESIDPVFASLKTGIDDFMAGALSKDAQRLSARLRGGVPRLVFTADLSRVARAIASLKKAKRRGAKRVIKTLGLDRETYILADLHQSPGGALHDVVKVYFQPDTGLARLADSFQPLEMADLAGLPPEADIFGVVRWNVTVFADTVLELAGPEARDTWNNVLQAGESGTGVHFHRDVVDQLSGLFAVYRDEQSGEELSVLDPLQGMSYLIGVTDGEALEDTLLDLLEATGMSEMVDIDDVDGVDVWSFTAPAIEQAGMGGVMPRMAFTPDAVLLVNHAQDLERALAPFAGKKRPSLSEESAPVDALRRHAGAFCIGYKDLASAAAMMVHTVHSLALMMGHDFGEVPEYATLKRWFPGLAVGSWVRTAEGLEFRSTIR